MNGIVDVNDPSYVGKKPCPKCGSKDNVYRWPDGHEFCFGRCGYIKRVPLTKDKICALLREKEQHELTLPNNVSQEIPKIPEDAKVPEIVFKTGEINEGLAWLKRYGILDGEIIGNSILWSQSQEQLIFPIFNENGVIIAWQARNFKPNSKKYLTYGKMDSILHILGLTKHQNTDIIIVEDMVSAIKVSRHFRCLPLFGSGCSREKLSRINRFTGHVRFWLDSDKFGQAIMLGRVSNMLGMKSSVIYTELDPKDHSDSDIKNLCSRT